jgi:hypothetical protein
MAGKLLKGAYSAAVAVLGALSTVLTGSHTFTDVTAGQWVTMALAGLVAFGGTFGLSTWAGPRINGGQG